MAGVRGVGAQIAFLVVLVGFYAYHTLAAFEVLTVPLPLGGFLSYAQVAALVIMAPLAIADDRNWKNIRLHAPIAVLCVIVVGYAIWHRLYGETWQRGSLHFVETMKLAAAFLSWYVIGLYLSRSRQFIWWLWASVAAMTLVTPFLVQTDPFSPLPADRQRFNAEVASYQYFASSLAVVTIVLVAMLEDRRLQWGAAFVGFFGIFLLGSRAELLGICSIIGILALLSWQSAARHVVKGIGVAIIAIVVAIGVAYALDANAMTRYADAINIMSSASFLERAGLLLEGFESIARSPIWGVYAGQMEGLEQSGTWAERMAFGSYVHNLFGMWAEFGIVPFLLYAGLSLSALAIGVHRVAVAKSGDPMDRLLLLVAVYTVMLMVAAKSIYWPMPAFAWGLMSARIAGQKTAI